jgi:hypothetical protein
MLDRLTKEKKLEKAKELLADAVNSDVEWQGEAREDFNFRDGNQWTADEERILKEELRPILTFNLTKSSIDLVMGLNEDNRIKYRATPVAQEDEFLCEVTNDLIDWIYENKEFDDEEDGALESSAICGRGFVGIDFLPDPKRFGEIIMVETDIPVHEVHLDPASRKTDITDASHLFWDKWVSKEDFKGLFPKFSDAKIDELIDEGRTFGDLDSIGVPSDIFEDDIEPDDSDYDRELDLNFYDRAKNMVRLIHMEYWQSFKRYYAFDPEAKGVREVPAHLIQNRKNLAILKANFKKEYNREFEYETVMDKKVKWLQFVGNEILYDDDSPMPYDGFSIVPLFAYRDVSKRSNKHFGIVKLMKDPQKEINKRWSQALNMLNQQVQTGIYAENDAFIDNDQAEMSIKEPGSVTWLNSGAIAQTKIMERKVPDFPNAPVQMEELAQAMLRKITGINPDLLGQDRGRQEPGVVVRLRQQQGMILLKPLFKAVKRMKKALFKRQMAIIMKYMPDEQILRILGEGERYLVDQQGVITDKQTKLQANIRDFRNLEYNVIAEEASGNMSKRMMELTALLEMASSGSVPVDPKIIVNKMDLAASEKLQWIQYIDSIQKAQQEAAQKEQEFEQRMQTAELELKKQELKMETFIDGAKINQMANAADTKARIDILELLAKGDEASMKMATELAKAELKRVGDIEKEVVKAKLTKKDEGENKDGKGKQTATS